jgi:transposase
LRYSRRTKRVSKILDSLSIELTGKLGSMLSKQLLIPVSSSSITRIVHRQQLPPIIQPMVLGVDDFAYRKGISYGTILIDMETSKPIDILPSREGKDLKKWLSKYPDVKIVTRDRASSYCSAINEVCPDAEQVADRFHLLMNLSDALDKYFKSMNPKIKKLIEDKSNELLNISDSQNAGCDKVDRSQSLSKVQKIIEIRVDPRQDTFNKVKELQAKGISKRKIARDLGISRNTVHSYLLLESLPPRISSRSTNIELFSGHIVARLNDQGYMMKDIIDEIYELGYKGSRTQAYYNINIIKEKFEIYTPDFAQIQKSKIPYVKPLSSRKLAKYIGSCLTAIKDPDERKYLQTLLDSELQVIRKLVQIFKTMLKRGCGNINRWIEFIKRSKYKMTGLITFANGLLRDIKAVKNGINMPWSNGAVEGHVNRIKSIKRQMYGRASFDLLRKKVILSQTG